MRVSLWQQRAVERLVHLVDVRLIAEEDSVVARRAAVVGRDHAIPAPLREVPIAHVRELATAVLEAGLGICELREVWTDEAALTRGRAHDLHETPRRLLPPPFLVAIAGKKREIIRRLL